MNQFTCGQKQLRDQRCRMCQRPLISADSRRFGICGMCDGYRGELRGNYKGYRVKA